MVLEETLVIHNPIDTSEVARAFKEAGMPTRITQTAALRSTASIRGMVRSIKALLEEEIAQSEALAEKIGIDDEEDIELREIYDTTLSVVEGVVGVITEFMEKYPAGTFVPIDEFKEWMSPFAALPQDEEDEEEEELDEDTLQQDALDPMVYRFMSFITLDENDMIDLGEEGVTVKQHVDPDDLILALPGDAMGDIGREAMNEHDITMEVVIASVPEYRLEFTPEAVFFAEMDRIDELIDELEIDEDEYLPFRESAYLKQIAATKIIDIIEEHGTMTPAEVVEALESNAIGGAESGLEIMLRFPIEFVKGLLNDLKKIGLVRKKGLGFRAAQ